MHCVSKISCAAFGAGFLSSCLLAGLAADGEKPQQDAKDGRFRSVSIQVHKKGSVPSALDFHLDGSCKAIRFYSPQYNKDDTHHRDPRTYFNDSGMLYTRGWMVISGTFSGEGEGFNIEPPAKDPFMLAIWSDIIGPAIEVRTANTDNAGSYIFQALDRNANYTFSIEQNGGLRWGAAGRAAMDTNLYRSAAKTLKTDGALVVAEKVGIGTASPASTLHVAGAQSVQRTAIVADYSATDSDYYIGVVDTSKPRTVTLPAAAGREGRVYVVKDESGEAAAHPITVKAKAGERIEGAETATISTNYGVMRIISSGKNWFGM